MRQLNGPQMPLTGSVYLTILSICSLCCNSHIRAVGVTLMQSSTLRRKRLSVSRSDFLRGGKKIDQRLTATALDRISDWLDIADSRSPAAVYPEIPETQDHEELCYAWMWAAVTIADIAEIPTEMLRMLATAARSMYAERD